MTPSPTLASLIKLVADDQSDLASASVTIVNDTNEIATNQGAVDSAQAALVTAQTGLTTAQAQLQTDSAALLPDALALQSDANALVNFLQANATPTPTVAIQNTVPVKS